MESGMKVKLRQGGFTLMEMIAAVVVMGTVMLGVYSLSEQSINNTKGSVVAMHLRTIGDATSQYVKANYATIVSHLISHPTTPYLVQVSDMGAYLPAGYSSTNSEGQVACALVLKSGNNLNALVLTEGGNTLDDLTLAQIAGTIGGAGGGIYSTATGTVKGSMGGWAFPIGDFGNANHKGKKCDGTGGAVFVGSGHPMMALWLSEGSGEAATLYRDEVPGNPNLNTMHTPLIMGSGSAAVKTEGSACNTGASDPLGSIARAPDGYVLSCIGSTWQRSGSLYWQDPVANFASLPTTDPDGAVRITKDTSRAFRWSSATSTWKALAVDQNGDMTVPNNLMVTNDATVNHNMVVNGDAGVRGYFSVVRDSQMTGKLDVNGRVTANEFIQINGLAVLGNPCSSSGLLAKSSGGVLLSCQSGVWQMAQGGGAPTYVSWPARFTGGQSYGGYFVSCPASMYVRGYMLNVPAAKVPALGGYRGDAIPYRQGCSQVSDVSAICYNVYTPGQWDNWNWGRNYDFGGALVCSR